MLFNVLHKESWLWNDVALAYKGLLHFPIGKKHLLRNFNSTRSVREHWEEDTPKKWMWTPRVRGWKLMGGSVAGPMLSLMKNLSYLLFYQKKKLEIDFEFEENVYHHYTSMSLSPGVHFLSLLVLYPPITLENHPFHVLSPIMIMIVLTSPSHSRSGACGSTWPIGALLSFSCIDIIQPMTLWGALGEAGWQGTEGELEREGRSQGTKCWIQACLKTETTSVPCSYTDPDILPLD